MHGVYIIQEVTFFVNCAHTACLYKYSLCNFSSFFGGRQGFAGLFLWVFRPRTLLLINSSFVKTVAANSLTATEADDAALHFLFNKG